MKKQYFGVLGLAFGVLLVSGCSQQTPIEDSKPKEKITSSTEKAIETKEKTKDSTEKNKEKKEISLTKEEISLAVYLDNYLDQHSDKTIETALADVVEQKEFAITSINKDSFNVTQAPALSGGLVASEVTITSDSISSKNFHGNQLKYEKDFTIKELTDKYGAYQDKLKEIVSASVSKSDKTSNLSNEELAMAVYVDNYLAGDISATINNLLSDAHLIFTDTSTGFSIVQGSYSSQEDITVNDNTITCILHSGATDTVEKSFNSNEINTKYENYSTKLKELITLGKSNSQKDSSDNVDTKNLTEEQVKTWMKNYLIQYENMDLDMVNNRVIVELSTDDDGYLIVNPRSTGGQAISSMGWYRINQEGALQKQNMSDNSWQTVSTTYLGSTQGGE